MQKIYVGNKPIMLSTKVEKENNFKNLMIDSIDIHEVLNLLKKEKYNSVRLIGSDSDELLDSFLKLLPNVVAGGGKVLNSSGHILFIYRNGKWDLPKGKKEPNETIDQTALREVKEETGIKELSITKPLQITYHIFKRNRKVFIKKTYWFEMYSSYSGNLKPQSKEGITKAKWIDPKKLKKVKKNIYANINQLL
mgnify:FL=1|tara:strand:- start:7 stop:588 length:582 start_codon:yes stop_codon:yes gene_type:complete